MRGGGLKKIVGTSVGLDSGIYMPSNMQAPIKVIEVKIELGNDFI